MDDLTLIRSFRAERADDDPRARAAAWRALEARFDPTPTASLATPTRSPRRGLLALAGAAALSAIVAGLLLLSSGPTAEPAAAEALQRIAGVAADSPPELRPGPSQFIYKKTKTLELDGWVPDGGRVSHGFPLPQADAFTALVPADHEYWVSQEGAGRMREEMGTPQFLSNAEKSRWEQAGSPLPFDESGENTALGTDARVLEARRGVIDIERPKREGGLDPNFGYADLTGLPTEPEALRHAIANHAPASENGPGRTPLGIKDLVLPLWGILQQPIVEPALRAAVFNALAELPSIELDSDATDLVGRAGYAISYVDRETGLRSEYIFDPETSEILGERTMLASPGQTPAYEGLPVGVTIRNIAYLQSEVVDSTREPTGDGQNGGSATTTGPVYLR